MSGRWSRFAIDCRKVSNWRNNTPIAARVTEAQPECASPLLP